MGWSLVAFSLLIGMSGLAAGLASLVAVRVVMGFADGAFTPASISATIACSGDERRGRNVGIQQMTHILFGLGIAPLLVAMLMNFLDWRWIFLIFLAPGLMIVWLTHRYIPDQPDRPAAVPDPEIAAHRGAATLADWKAVLGHRNVPILMLLMLCWLMCLITTSAFLPSYLIDHLRLDETRMGTVMSAIGFGAASGSLLLTWASDRYGRKSVVLVSACGALVALLGLSTIGASPVALFGMLFVVQFFNFAGLTLTVGPLSAESVRPHLMATASGMVIACGEILGGARADRRGALRRVVRDRARADPADDREGGGRRSRARAARTNDRATARTGLSRRAKRPRLKLADCLIPSVTRAKP
jgi:predicted MFS family arabinose efflux permease